MKAIAAILSAALLPSLAHASNSFFVGNFFGNLIEQYSPAGTDLGQFVTAGSGGLSEPGGITFGPDGNLYVASRGSGQILEYNGSTGAFLKVFSTPNDEGIANDIEFSSNGNAYLNATDGFYILNGATGAIINEVSIPGVAGYGGAFLPSNGDYLRIDKAGTVVEYTLSGSLVGTYANIATSSNGILIGPDNRVYVAEQANGEVAVVPPGGGTATAFSTGLNSPDYLALFGSGFALTDFLAQRIYELDGSGNVTSFFATSFQPYGIAIQAVPEPGAIAYFLSGVLALAWIARSRR